MNIHSSFLRKDFPLGLQQFHDDVELLSVSFRLALGWSLVQRQLPSVSSSDFPHCQEHCFELSRPPPPVFLHFSSALV